MIGLLLFAASAAPVVPPPAPAALPVPTVQTLSNGAEVWVLPRVGVPLTRIEVSLLRGHLNAPDPVALRVAAALLDAGTEDHPGGAWADAVSSMGAQADVGVGALRAWVDVEAIAGREADAIALAAEAAWSPQLRRRDIRRVRRAWASSAADGWRSGRRVSEGATILAVYPEGHPRGRIDTARDYRRVTPRRVRDAWRWLLETAPVSVVVSGAGDPDAVLAALEASWGRAATGERVPPPAPPPPAGPRVVLVDHAGADQAQIQAVLPGPGEGDPDTAGALLVAGVLGGGFTSRLNHRLREELGIAYGAWARLEQAPGHGQLVLETSVSPSDVGVALSELNDALYGMLLFSPTAEEVERARRAQLLVGARALDRLGDLTWPYGRAQVGGLAPDAPSRLQADIGSFPLAGIPAAASALLDTDDVVWLVIADRFAVERVLDEAGWTPDAVWSGRDVVEGRVPGRAIAE